MKAIFILGLLLFGNILHIIDRNVMSLFIADIRDEMLLDDSQAALIMSIFVVVLSVVAIPIARLADTKGPRVVIAGSVFAWSVATFLCGSAAGYTWLLTFRMAVGGGEAGFPPAALAALALLFSSKTLGRAIAVFTLGASIGQALGFIVMGQLHDVLGWRGSFHVLGTVGVALAATIWLVWPYCAPKYTPRETSADRPGFITTFRFLFKIPGYTPILIAAVIHAISAYAVYQWVPTLLREYRGMSGAEAGELMGLLSIAGVAGSVFTGFVIDLIPTNNKLGKCMAYSSVSVALTVPFYIGPILFPEIFRQNLLFVAWFLASVYYAATYFVLQKMVPIENRASANAIVLTSFTVAGLGLGPMLVGVISDFLSSISVGESLAWAISVGAALNLVSAVFFFWTSRKLKASPPQWEEVPAKS